MSWDPGLRRGWHHSHVQRDPDRDWNRRSFFERLKMRFGRKNVVIKTHAGLKIVSMPHTTKHSHEIAVCPPRFNPGDEEHLSLSRTGKVVFDTVSHAKHHAEKVKEQTKVADWNSSNPFERFKNKLKSKGKR